MGKKWTLPSMGLLVVLTAMAVIFVNGASAGKSPLLSVFPETNLQQIASLNLIMSVTPRAVTVRDRVNLEILITSDRSEAALPEIQIDIEDNLSFNPDDLPSGTSFNIQSNVINWQPIIEPGSSSRLTIPLIVNVTYPGKPEATITARLNEGQNQQEFTTTVWAGMPPQVAVVFDPPQVAVGQPVQIRANMLNSSGPYDQSWSLGDGRVMNVNDPLVVFPSAGTFQVSVEVANPIGTATASSLITVVPVPSASFTIDDPTPSANQEVAFLNQSGGEGQLLYRWDFGDGTISQDKNPTHTYLGQGTYLVSLLVQNEFGQTETSQVVTVGQPPVADFIIPETGIAGTMMNIQSFTDDTVTTITWEMGDGRTYEGPLISHVYWQAGDFTVTMIASNEFDTFQVSKVVHIEPGALAFYLPIVRKGGESEAFLGVLEPALLDQTRLDGEESQIIVEHQNLIPYEFPPNLSHEEQLLAYINQARELNDLPPVTYNAQISEAARAHTIDMASNGYGGIPGTPEFTPHTGTDGSTPALRLQRTGYPGGYGAEATAWGFQTALGPAEFWLNNPPHRRIILNPYVDEVGLAYERNLNAPNIWYWTALFASMSIPKIEVPEVVATPNPNPTPTPVLQLLGPPQNSEFVLAAGNNLIFSWSWNGPIENGQRFVVYLKSGRTVQIGTVQELSGNNQYQFKTAVTNVPVAAGQYQWQIRLEDIRSAEVLAESPFWPVQFLNASSDPEPTPEPTSTP